jgi:osmotically-inducible protein OsmY
MKKQSVHGAAFAAAMAVLLMVTPAFAKSDPAIAQAIEARFAKKDVAQNANVQVAVSNGEVTLTGFATTLPESRLAAKLARKEAKVVHNQIKVRLDEPVKDSQIVKGIRSAILRYPYYNIFDYVQFQVKDGAVVLVGSVVQPYKKTDIENRVARVPGVTALRDDITVQSFSSYDSELRYSLAQRIYGDPRFVQYANQPHPPIRILVNHGNVTLAGWVNSPVEKAILGNIARSSLSFKVTNDLHVDTELPPEDGGQKGNTSSRS